MKYLTENNTLKRKILFVGMDVHKESISICAITAESKDVYERELPNKGSKIVKLLKSWEEDYDLHCVYEAGCMGNHLQRLLTTNRISCVITAPSKIPVTRSTEIKTDRRDARKLAKLLKNGDIHSVHISSRENEAIRDLIRARDALRLDLAGHRKRLLAFLLRRDLIYREGSKNWTHRHDKWLRSLEFKYSQEEEAFSLYYQKVKGLREQLDVLGDRLREISLTCSYKNEIAKLRCFHGIDTLTAMIIIYEIDDFHRFKRAKDFMAYIGLVPGEFSSGSKRRQTKITKQGNPNVRRVLIEAGWNYRFSSNISKRVLTRQAGQPVECVAYANRAKQRLNKKFRKLTKKGYCGKHAATSVARELSGFIWGMMTENWE